MSAKRISNAVMDRLTGYAIRIARNVRCVGNTVNIHKILTPHTPITVKIAGISEIRKPRRYPDIFSYNILNAYAENTITNLVYPSSMTCGSLLNNASSVFPDSNIKRITADVAIVSSTIHKISTCRQTDSHNIKKCFSIKLQIPSVNTDHIRCPDQLDQQQYGTDRICNNRRNRHPIYSHFEYDHKKQI